MMEFDELDIKRRELSEAYYKVFSNEDGEKVWNDLQEHCCMNAISIYGQDLVFNEGKRCIGQYIKYQIEQYEKEILNGNNE